METIGMIVISALAYYLASQNSGFLEAIPFLGALALGAQKTLPLMQQSWAAISTIRGNHGPLEDTIQLLEQSIGSEYNKKNISSLTFENEILLKNISFRYATKLPYVIKDFSLSIKKGSRIGFIGKNGSGKSTIMDIIMGLLEPTRGSFLIDGEKVSKKIIKKWQRNVAHVPQSIFLSDASIEENIAFGISYEEIDHLRVLNVAKMAQIDELIQTLPGKYKSLIGESGDLLSGGQRQRIGIARALYNNAEVIIFDEATSSLDSKTEASVISEIANLDKNITVLIITHRLTTLKNCDQIIKIDSGEIINVGTYKELISNLD